MHGFIVTANTQNARLLRISSYAAPRQSRGTKHGRDAAAVAGYMIRRPAKACGAWAAGRDFEPLASPDALNPLVTSLRSRQSGGSHQPGSVPATSQSINLPKLGDNLLSLVTHPRHRGPPGCQRHTSGRTTSVGVDHCGQLRGRSGQMTRGF